MTIMNSSELNYDYYHQFIIYY